MVAIQNHKPFTISFENNRFRDFALTFYVVCSRPEPLLTVYDVCEFCLFCGSPFRDQTFHLPDGFWVKFSKFEPTPTFNPSSLHEFGKRKFQPILPNHEDLKILWVHCEVIRYRIALEEWLKPKLV